MAPGEEKLAALLGCLTIISITVIWVWKISGAGEFARRAKKEKEKEDHA